MSRCPHCGAAARAEHKGDRAWLCAICGGPRIPGNHGGATAAAALAKEKRETTQGRAQSFLTIALALIAAFFTLVGLAVMPAAVVGKILLLALAVGPLLLAFRARAKAKKARGEARAAHDEAWLAAAEEIARRAKKGITAAELGKALAIPAPEADKMLTELAGRDKTRIDVDDDSAVRYRIGQDEFEELDDAAHDETKKKKELSS